MKQLLWCLLFSFVCGSCMGFTLPNTFPLTLGPSNRDVTLDYKQLVAGLTRYKFKVASKENFRLEMVYSETLKYSRVGDWNTFPSLQHTAYYSRVVNQDFSGSAANASDFEVQGGYRFHYIKLATPNVTVTIEDITVDLEYYLGKQDSYFNSSDAALNKMWEMGSTTVRLNMIPKGNIYESFQLTPEGIRIPPGKGGMYFNGYTWSGYIYQISIKTLKGGFSFGMGGQGDQFNVQVNTDNSGTLNNVLVYKGPIWLVTSYSKTFKLSKPVQLNTWITVKCSIDLNNDATIFIGDEKFKFPKVDGTNKALVGTISLYSSSTQDFVVKDVKVVNSYAVTIYSSAMNTTLDMENFYAGKNSVPVYLDGTKRDRFLWSGDLLSSGPALYHSFNESAYVRETARILLGYRQTSGLSSGYFSPVPPPPGPPTDSSNRIWSYSYSIVMFKVIDDHYMYTGDVEFTKSQWPLLKDMIVYFMRHSDRNGLVVTEDNGLTIDWANNFWGNTKWVKIQVLYINALDISCKFAKLFGEKGDIYCNAAVLARKGLETLWDPVRGYYPASQAFPDIVAQDALGMAITYVGLNASRAATLLSTMDKYLLTPGGYLANNIGGNVYYSPYTSYFHAEGAFESGNDQAAMRVIRNTYDNMIKEDGPEYTGAMWERTLPGKTDPIISHAHAWSAGVVSLLSKYVMGVRTVTPGYATWEIKPRLVVNRVEGSVSTVRGLISVQWESVNKDKLLFRMHVNTPVGTNGTVSIPIKGCLVVDGKTVNSLVDGRIETALSGGVHDILVKEC